MDGLGANNVAQRGQRQNVQQTQTSTTKRNENIRTHARTRSRHHHQLARSFLCPVNTKFRCQQQSNHSKTRASNLPQSKHRIVCVKSPLVDRTHSYDENRLKTRFPYVQYYASNNQRLFWSNVQTHSFTRQSSSATTHAASRTYHTIGIVQSGMCYRDRASGIIIGFGKHAFTGSLDPPPHSGRSGRAAARPRSPASSTCQPPPAG